MTQASLERLAAAPPARTKRRFFLGFGAVIALIVLVGFSRTFFIPLARQTFSAPWFVYVHGTLFFVWIGLLVAQAALVAAHRTRVHRRLGRTAFGLVPLMVASGVAVAVWSSARDLRAGSGDEVVAFFFGELMDMALFSTFAALALLLRRNTQAHKRLILLGTVAILGAALGRIPEIRMISPYVPVLLLLSIAWYDVRTRPKLHPATLWGGSGLLVGIFTQPMIGAMPWWLSIGRQLLEHYHY
jgi:hypothetical protein